MKRENSRKDLLESVRKYVQQSEEKERIQLITNAIGERRDRDLLDILSQIEQDRGWSETVDHLSKAGDYQYSLPLGIGPRKSKPEELKFRESIFQILGFSGLEPVPITTKNLLANLRVADSLVDATGLAWNLIEPLIIKQIESGDLLFFDTDYFDSTISKSIIDEIKQSQQEQIQAISISSSDKTFDVLPLWYNELGRQALSKTGISGTCIDYEQLAVVSSVIQQPFIQGKESRTTKNTIHEPSNELYRELLNSMIHHDLDSLSYLSSKLSYPIIKTILEISIDQYNSNQTSKGYHNIIVGINAHIRIRFIDSIGFLEQLTQSENLRIVSAAITALGNFYHESSAGALVDLLCRTKNKEIVEAASNAILNVSKRCLETRFVITNILESNECGQNRHLKRLQREIGSKGIKYYE